MLVCWEWLSQYLELSVEVDELANRFAMTGLNHESTQRVGDDVVLDLEVTSNRPDCLGHIGVAREAAVILGRKLQVPTADLSSATTSAANVAELISIENQMPAGCTRYTARVIRGVRIGPSPAWLVRRLQAIGVAAVNNVVDATNYVMFECGQPLHAFDLQQLRGGKVIIRAAEPNETLVAIDHRTYAMDPQMIVIADAERAVAIGGVMGGADSEVTSETTDVLIEVAAFNPLAVRRAARLLKLQSASSFRFERTPDPGGLDWASRRCCELILEIAGGQICKGVVEVGQEPIDREPILFRLAQIPRVLGIEISPAEAQQILVALGCQVTSESATVLAVAPPTWRGDLTREVDLIEEVARIHGYENIPEDVSVPLSVADVRPKDIALSRARHTLSACGIDEAMTPSVISDTLEALGSPWTEVPPLQTETPLLVGARTLRRSLIPSLLSAVYTNQAQSIRKAQLYEIATLYLPAESAEQLPRETCGLSIVTAGELRFIKGVVEEIVVQVVGRACSITWSAEQHALFEPGSLQRVSIAGELLGFVGLVSRAVCDKLSLDLTPAAAELNFDMLTAHLQEVRRADRVSMFPAVSRDLNFVVSEDMAWSRLEQLCLAAGGELLQSVDYRETYRDPKKDGSDRKRLLLTLHFQSFERTLTGSEVDQQVAAVVEACRVQLDASLLS